jgi:hypothetical protein
VKALVRNLVFASLAVAALATAGDQTPAPDATPAPTPTPTADAEEQLEEFVPSEEVPADQAVAFPVDI